MMAITTSSSISVKAVVGTARQRRPRRVQRRNQMQPTRTLSGCFQPTFFGANLHEPSNHQPMMLSLFSPVFALTVGSAL